MKCSSAFGGTALFVFVNLPCRANLPLYRLTDKWRYGEPHMDKKTTPTIRDLYPQFTDEELAEAEDNLDQYLTLVLRIFERLELETIPPVEKLTPHAGTLPCPMSESQSS